MQQLEAEWKPVFGKPGPDWRIAQTHTHSTFSDGTKTPTELVDLARGVVHDLVITDHDTPEGGLVAWDYNNQFMERNPNAPKLTVWVGQEVTTSWGDVLGLNTNATIICNLTGEEAARGIRDQGGIIIIPHPGAPLADALDWEQVDYLHNKGLVHAVELENGGVMSGAQLRAFPGIRNIFPSQNTNILAHKEYRKRTDRPAATGGSDAHLSGIGAIRSIVTLYPPSMTLTEAIVAKQTAIAVTGEIETLQPTKIIEHRVRAHFMHQRRLEQSGGIIWAGS
jgi:histidinol phosphatase-like PHP family hydrolase